MGHYDNCRPENCAVCGQSLSVCNPSKHRAVARSSGPDRRPPLEIIRDAARRVAAAPKVRRATLTATPGCQVTTQVPRGRLLLGKLTFETHSEEGRAALKKKLQTLIEKL